MNDETLSNSDNPGAEATAGDAHTEELAQREDDVCAPPKAVAQEEAEPDTDTQAADAGTTVGGDDEEAASDSGEESAEVESSVEVSEAEARKWKPVAIPRWAQLPMSARAGWIATWVTTILAAFIRLPGLGTIRTLIFDETYYVKDAYSQIALGYEGSWAKDTDPAFISGDFSGLSAEGGYVVHPSVGKWLIGLGMRAFGPTNPVGWRISAAIAGIILVFLTARIAQHLFRSPAITALAGFFMATDGIAIVLSRTGLLDVFLAMFAAAAFLAVLKLD